MPYHRYDDRKVPVFPHLATLSRGGYRFYDFAATQQESETVERVNDTLDKLAVIYSHTENFYRLCSCCWRNEDTNHTHAPEEHKVVHGRIAVSPDITDADLLARIDKGFAGIDGAHLIAPDLARAAGQSDRREQDGQRTERSEASRVGSHSASSTSRTMETISRGVR